MTGFLPLFVLQQFTNNLIKNLKKKKNEIKK
jgi:hypothetical protein